MFSFSTTISLISNPSIILLAVVGFLSVALYTLLTITRRQRPPSHLWEVDHLRHLVRLLVPQVAVHLVQLLLMVLSLLWMRQTEDQANDTYWGSLCLAVDTNRLMTASMNNLPIAHCRNPKISERY